MRFDRRHLRWAAMRVNCFSSSRGVWRALRPLGHQGFLKMHAGSSLRPGIVPLKAGLTQPGAETARLEGHTGCVKALCPLSGGRLASGSDDGTIWLWEAT